MFRFFGRFSSWTPGRWRQLNPQQRTSLAEAIEAGYRTREQLGVFANQGFNLNLDEVSPTTELYPTTIDKLILWAESSGRLKELLGILLKATKDNALVVEPVTKIVQEIFPAVTSAPKGDGKGKPPDPVPPPNPRPSNKSLASAFGWLLVTAGVVAAAVTIIVKATRYGASLPVRAQPLRLLEWSSFVLVTSALMLAGIFLVCLKRWPGVRGWLVAAACLLPVGWAVWRDVVKYTTKYQIAEIRNNDLVRAASVESDHRRAEVLTSWAVALASDGRMEEALRAVTYAGVGDPDDNPILKVARTLENLGRRAEAESAWKNAAAAARDQPQNDDQCQALASLARAEVLANRVPEAKAIAVEARVKSKGSVSATTQVAVMLALVQVLTRSSKSDDARDAWRSAIEACHTIPDPLPRYLALAKMARHAAEVGAVNFAREALAIARKVPFPKPESGPNPEDGPDAVAADMVVSFLGESEIDDANVLAGGIRDQAQRARSLAAVAAKLERSDRNPEAARVWAAAVEACSRNGDAASQAVASAEVAAALESSGIASSKAEPLWSRAILTTRSVPDDRRNQVFCEVAAALVRAGRADRALCEAGKLYFPAQRSAAFTRVGQALQLAPDVRPQADSLELAYKAAQKIEQDQLRSPAVATVAKGLARIDQFREARLRGDECNRSLDKLDSYAMIMMEYYRRGRRGTLPVLAGLQNWSQQWPTAEVKDSH